jgi:hypothetical protein
MSTRFWMGSGLLIGGGVIVGLAMGSFATSPPPRDLARYGSEVAEGTGDSSAFASSDGDKIDGGDSNRGPGTIVCKGCGPTLAERRMAADNIGANPDGMIDRTSDPVVAEYLAQGDSVPPSLPPSDIHRLPAHIQRFADGQEETPPAAPPPALSRTAPMPQSH